MLSYFFASPKEIETQKNSAISDIDFCASDIRFHRAMADASHNSVLKFGMFAVIEALQPIENMSGGAGPADSKEDN